MKRFLFLSITVLMCLSGYAQDLKALVSKAKNGDLQSQVTLGEMYLYGSGVGLNLDSALYWMHRSAGEHYVSAGHLINLGVRSGDKDDDRAVYLAWFNNENVVSNPEYSLQLQGNEFVYPNQDIRATVNNGQPVQLHCDDQKFFSHTITLSEGVNVVRVFRNGKCVIERPVVYTPNQTRSGGDVDVQGMSRDVQVSDPKFVRKAALVIGNSSYRLSPLRNPQNDATDVATKLRTLGFDVTLETNLNLQAFEQVLTDFGKKIQGYDVAMFFYAGHGVQVQGENYLVPVDAVIGSESDVKYKCENANMVLDLMEEGNVGLKIVVLDACRNNPFARSLGRGLASMTSPSGTFLAFATGPGDIALDGKNRNSPYTTAILQHISTPGISIYECFQNISESVNAATRGHQNPWISASLRSMFYFNK